VIAPPPLGGKWQVWRARVPAACSIPSVTTISLPAAAARMTPHERRASGSLAIIFAARMLGLFLVLPVFALEAARYPGGNDPAQVGLAMGIYGLTQAVLQLPLGLASDRFGRKRVIILGLLVFAAGSFLASAATSLPGLILGRAPRCWPTRRATKCARRRWP
jgi:MFS family permease